MSNFFDFPDLATSIADGLFLDLEFKKTDPEVFEFFFQQRVQDVERLSSRLKDVNNFGGNVLVVAEPGVGKTLFLQTFLRGEDTFQPWSKDVNRTFIDLRTRRTSDRTEIFVDTFLGDVARVILQHLRRINPTNPYHELNGAVNNQDRYDSCVTALHECQVRGLPRR